MGRKLYVGNLTTLRRYECRTRTNVRGTRNGGVGTSDHGPRDRSLQRLRFRGNENRSGGSSRIAGLNGKEMEGRSLTVNEARPKAEGRAAGVVVVVAGGVVAAGVVDLAAAVAIKPTR